MANMLPSFNRRAVDPIECLRSGFALIKDQYWLFFGITAVGILIAGLVPMAILMGPMMCGIYLVFFERMRGRRIEFSLLFKGFDYFVNSLVATLLVLAPMLLLMVPFYAFLMAGLFGVLRVQQRGAPHQPDPAAVAAFVGGLGVFVLVLMIIGLVIGVLFAFVYPLIVDRKLSAVQAIKGSIRASLANFWGIAGLFLLNCILSMVGVLFCYVGAFLIMPIGLAANAIMYRQVFGLSENQSAASTSPPIT